MREATAFRIGAVRCAVAQYCRDTEPLSNSNDLRCGVRDPEGNARAANVTHGENLVVEAAIGPDNALSVVCSAPPNSVKGWTRAKVYVENEMFCHESGGTLFEHTGALKADCIAIGAPHEHYGESIDDFC